MTISEQNLLLKKAEQMQTGTYGQPGVHDGFLCRENQAWAS